MSASVKSHPGAPAIESGAVLKLAIMAVGGQGGGVLTGWIELLARSQDYACQATSVAGVAQRTGTTIYYVEMAPAGPALPVFALAPSPGDVDIFVAAELMEAGRAIQRGFITSDRTTLIASSHRSLAVSEKIVPGDGIANSSEVLAAAQQAAAHFICLDMEALAVAQGSVISATLFGALAAAECLPFPKSAYEDAIKAGGKGVDSSLRAFNAAFDACQQDSAVAADVRPQEAIEPHARGPESLRSRWDQLVGQIDSLPEPVRAMARAGLAKVVDFMDLAYGQEYLDRVLAFAGMDDGADEYALSLAAAKYIANAMAYDDVIRVADLKTRSSRFRRIAVEMKEEPGKLLRVTEYMHPGPREIIGMLPAGMAGRVGPGSRLMSLMNRFAAKGRRFRSDRPWGFILLYLLGGLKRYRRRTYRHAQERVHLDRWLDQANRIAVDDPRLATEVLCCGRLIKGYSETHRRSHSKFDTVMAMLEPLDGRTDAADWVRRLREAALQDEGGDALDGAIRTIKSI